MESQMQAQSSSKSWIWIVLVVIVAAAVIWLWRGNSSQQSAEVVPNESAVSADDSLSTIEQELNSTDLGNLNQEMQSLEADLNSL